MHASLVNALLCITCVLIVIPVAICPCPEAPWPMDDRSSLYSAAWGALDMYHEELGLDRVVQRDLGPVSGSRQRTRRVPLVPPPRV